MIKNILITLLIAFVGLSAYADPPEPPVGKRWILNEKFSDEFNGTSLDLTKWYDHHPTWNGRVPGIFLPSQVTVGNGYMTIRGEKLSADTVITYRNGRKQTFNIACGAVVSRTLDASFGYYECRFKAARTSMSTTFWLSTRKSYDGPEDCDDEYGLELDFQECIGREGDFDGTYFARGMHSNSHFWYTDCEGKRHDYRAQQVLFNSDELASDAFNIYGGWWHNESRVSYYYNNGEPKSHDFYSSVKQNPFDQSMGLNLVSETYPFPWISLPDDEELADSSRNICYYDWVRAYILVDVDQAVTPLSSEPVMFEDNVHFCTKPEAMKTDSLLQFLISYEAKTDREIHMELFDEKGSVLEEAVFPALGGHGRKNVKLETDNALTLSSQYSVQLHIRPSRSVDNAGSFDQDSFKFIFQ